jgi:hypothetical protein
MVTGGHGTDVQAVLSNPNRVQSQGEEIANSISHGAGLVGALVGTPFLVMHATRHGDAGFIVGTSVFAASMILLYLASDALPCVANRQSQTLFSDHRAFRDLYPYRRHLHTVNPWHTPRCIGLDALRGYLGSCHSRGSAEGIL